MQSTAYIACSDSVLTRYNVLFTTYIQNTSFFFQLVPKHRRIQIVDVLQVRIQESGSLRRML
jgi:hypothetical protein